MPIDVSLDLALCFWEEFFYTAQHAIPHTRDSWECYILDALGAWNGGGEL